MSPNSNVATTDAARLAAGHMFNVRYWVRAAREASRHALQARAEYFAAKSATRNGKRRGALWGEGYNARRRRDVFMAEARRALARAEMAVAQ